MNSEDTFLTIIAGMFFGTLVLLTCLVLDNAENQRKHELKLKQCYLTTPTKEESNTD